MQSEERFREIEEYLSGTTSDKIIEIKSVYKTGKHTVQPAKDDRTGWWAGVERLSDEEKKGRSYYVNVGLSGEEARHNTKLVLRDGYTFDMNTEVDRINWEWVKHLPVLAMSFAEAQESKALFYVNIEGKESEEKNKSTKTKIEAANLIINDSPNNYHNRALLLDMDFTGEPISTVEEYLLDVAQKNPEKIFNIYREGMRVNLLYVQAKQKGIIKVQEDGVIKFGVTILGISDEAAVAYLKENEDILELLERDVKPEYFEKKQSKSKETPLEKARRIKAEKEKKEGSKA